MFRSLRARLVLAFSGVIIISLIVAGAALALLLRGYQVRLTEARLRDLSAPAFEKLARQADSGPRGVPAARIAGFVQSQAADLKVAALLVDPSGRVVVDSTEAKSFFDHRLDLPDPRTIEPGGARFPSGRLRAPDGTLWVYSATRLRVLDGTETRFAILVLATPSGTLASGLEDLVRVLAFGGLIALAASIVLAALVARSLSGPLRRLERATEAVAKGNYETDAPVEGPAEIGRLAASFNEMTRQVKAARQLQRSFVANVSHELRTPLTAIHGFSQAIVEGAVTDEEGYRRAGRIINEGAQRLIRLVEELLDLARIEAGQVEMALESIDPAAVAERAIDAFEIRAKERRIEIVRRLGVMPRVRGDPDRLAQVLTNVVDNAIRHTPEGGRVEVRSRTDAQGWAELAVEDAGPGLKPDELARIFERFQRGAGGGTGLGLAIAREIARVHGGRLWAESEPGSGARFILRLPPSSTAR